jgi:hypothetical protein
MRGRLVIFILAGAGVLVVSSVILYREKESMEIFPNRTTFSARAGGYKALYLTVKEIGYPPVSRWQRRLTDFTQPEDALVITSLRPGESIGARERDVVQEWVQDGGRLILLGHYFPVEPRFGDLLEVFELAVDEGDGGPVSPLADMPGMVVGVPPVQPTVYTRGVEEVEVGSSLRLWSSEPDRVTHLEDEQGSLCVSFRYGKGRVVAVADADVGSNQRIDRADNVRFLLNVLTQEAGAGTVWFDEYHHGFREAGGLVDYAANSGAEPIVLQLAILAAFWLLATARRFGPLRPLATTPHRQTAEHVDCLAELYSAARARSYALGEIYRKFKADAARVSGLPFSTETPQVAMTYARKFGYNADELKRVMLLCEQEQEREEIGARHLYQLVKSLEEFAPLPGRLERGRTR